MHCLVTGGSGYLGRALIPALRSRQIGVRALAHSDADLPPVDDVVRADLAAPDGTLPVEGVDAVIHLAGIAHQRADAAAYRRVNIDGTVALAREALEAGVERFLFVSSVKAQGASPDSAEPSFPDYGSSKLLAEQALQALCADTPMRLIIVRPALVYDGELTGHLRWLQRWVSLHMPRPPAGGERSMIGRGDLIEILVALLHSGDEAPGHLTVTDGQRYSTRRLHEALAQASGRRSPLPSPPAALWRFAAAILDRLRGEEPGSLWERLAGDECYVSDDLTRLLARPPRTFEQVLAQATEAAS